MLFALEAEHSWRVLAFGFITGVILVGITWRFSSEHVSTSPPNMLAGEAALQSEYEEATRQAASLREELERARAAERARADERLRQQALRGSQALDDVGARAKTAVESTREAAMIAAKMAATGEMPKDLKDLDGMLDGMFRKSVSDIVPQVAPVFARGVHVHSVLKDTATGVRERLMEFATREATDLHSKLQEAVDLPDDQLGKVDVPGFPQLSTMLQMQKGDFELPPISLFVACIFAPTQLRWMLSQDHLHICATAILLGVTVTVLIVDWDMTCGDAAVKVWALGYAILCFLNILLRTLNMRAASAGLKAVEEEKAAHPFLSTGNRIWDAFLQIQVSSDTSFKAFFAYTDVRNSWTYLLSKLIGVALMGWGAFGLFAAMAHVIEDTMHCDSGAVVVWMRARAFLYVLFFFYTITQAVLGIVVRLQMVERAIMTTAINADQEGEFPVFSVLARSFLMQDLSSELRIREAIVNAEIQVLQNDREKRLAEAAEFEKKLTEARAEAQKLAVERERDAEATEAERLEHLQKLAQCALSKAEPFVAVAAHKYAEGGGFEGMAQQAADVSWAAKESLEQTVAEMPPASEIAETAYKRASEVASSEAFASTVAAAKDAAATAAEEVKKFAESDAVKQTLEAAAQEVQKIAESEAVQGAVKTISESEAVQGTVARASEVAAQAAKRLSESEAVQSAVAATSARLSTAAAGSAEVASPQAAPGGAPAAAPIQGHGSSEGA